MSLLTDLPFGWLTADEAHALTELARDKQVLEMGSYLGRSTVTMARVAMHVVSVDWHLNSKEIIDSGHGGDSLPEFVANLTKHGVRDKVSVCVMDTRHVARLFAPASFDLVFVDAAHDFGAVMRDGKTAFRLARTAGVVCFHDYGGEWTSVTAAVDGLVASGPWKVVAVHDHLAELRCV
jgi:predicted O-methyltransferase YrrM